MPGLNSRHGSRLPETRSPNLDLLPARRKEFTAHPRIAGDASCPYRPGRVRLQF